MSELTELVKSLIENKSEEEWYEFKDSWFDPVGIAEYISSMSNVAALMGKENAYLIWGVDNETHALTNTTFDYQKDIKNEPLEHFLARQITPDINFQFQEIFIEQNRLVVLTIPVARQVPTAFNNSRFLRIGSSKVNLNKYPERESKLFDILRNGLPTMESVEAYSQELTFRKLFLYYEDKGIILNKQNFKKNLNLLTRDGKYNLLAQVLSDDSQIPIRVSIFQGNDKTAPLYSVREFGNNCILNSLDKILEYGDVLNIMQADEENRVVERKEIPLFNQDVYREAIINAFVHNSWVEGNAPMITVFRDRIEILSRGTLAPAQTINGFYLGESVPVNRKLSDIFLQLHISERSGRGVPKITGIYGKDAYDFRENSITVTIPYEKIMPKVGNKVGNEVGNKDIKLNPTRQRIVDEMRNDPNVTQQMLITLVGVGKASIENNISFLKKNGIIDRIGSKKNGYWKVL